MHAPRRAPWLLAQGKDPREAWAKAQARYERSLEIDRRISSTASDLAGLWLAMGDWLRDHREDPSHAYAKAHAAADLAISIDPHAPDAHDIWANIHLSRRAWLQAR